MVDSSMEPSCRLSGPADLVEETRPEVSHFVALTAFFALCNALTNQGREKRKRFLSPTNP